MKPSADALRARELRAVRDDIASELQHLMRVRREAQAEDHGFLVLLAFQKARDVVALDRTIGEPFTAPDDVADAVAAMGEIVDRLVNLKERDGTHDAYAELKALREALGRGGARRAANRSRSLYDAAVIVAAVRAQVARVEARGRHMTQDAVFTLVARGVGCGKTKVGTAWEDYCSKNPVGTAWRARLAALKPPPNERAKSPPKPKGPTPEARRANDGAARSSRKGRQD